MMGGIRHHEVHVSAGDAVSEPDVHRARALVQLRVDRPVDLRQDVLVGPEAEFEGVQPDAGLVTSRSASIKSSPPARTSDRTPPFILSMIGARRLSSRRSSFAARMRTSPASSNRGSRAASTPAAATVPSIVKGRGGPARGGW